MGPDPFADDINLKFFRELLAKKRGSIKSTLMDQSMMAGIGNVYTDEILFQAGIHPKYNVPDLSDDQIKTIFNKMKTVLKTAIDHKANPENMPKSYLLPHRKPDTPCPKCDGIINKITVSGRATYFCTKHQSK